MNFVKGIGQVCNHDFKMLCTSVQCIICGNSFVPITVRDVTVQVYI